MPCTAWPEKDEGNFDEYGEDIMLESYPADLAEYLIFLLLGQRFFEILQFSRLAEFAARTVHLENSVEKIKEEQVKNSAEIFSSSS